MCARLGDGEKKKKERREMVIRIRKKRRMKANGLIVIIHQ